MTPPADNEGWIVDASVALPLDPGDHHTTAQLALAHNLTFYDASYAATAIRAGRKLLSADEDLLAPGLAVTLREALE